MYKRLLITVTVVLAFLMMTSFGKEKKNNELLFFVQKDMMKYAQKLDISSGFNYLIKNISPETNVTIYQFITNKWSKVVDSPAADLQKKPFKLEFASSNASTTPYKCLYNFIKTKNLKDKKIIFITTGASNDVFNHRDTPSRYPLINKINKLLKKRNIRLISIFVQTANYPVRNLYSLSYNTLFWITKKSGGKFYYDFNSFKGLFSNFIKNKTINF